MHDYFEIRRKMLALLTTYGSFLKVFWLFGRKRLKQMLKTGKLNNM